MKKKNIKLVACLSLTGFLACGLPYMNNSNYNIGIMKVKAAEITDTWENGNTICTLDSNGILTITAKPNTDGKMSDYSGNYIGYNKYIKEIIIKNNVTYIGYTAFKDATNLKKITIPETLISVGDYAFYGCYNLSDFTIPQTLKSIGNYAFYNTGLSQLIIPENAIIGHGAFGHTNITEVIIPNSVNISSTSSIFSGCTNLNKITFPQNIEIIPDSILSGCINLTEIKIPETVKSIGNSAFLETGLTEIIIPQSVTNIGNSAFKSCSNLTELIIPENVTSIGNSAFAKCTNLTNIVIPEKVTSLGEKLFQDCEKLEYLELNCKLNYSYDYSNSPFLGSKFKKVVIGNNITQIPNYLFYNVSSLNEVTIHNNINFIGTSAFFGTGITEIIIPEKITSINDSTFTNCTNLTKIIIHENVTSIGSNAFKNTNLIEIIIPENVISIGNDAFYNCLNLNTLIFKNKMNYKQLTALKNLENIYLLNGIDSSITKSMIPSTATVYCMANSTVETWCINNNVAYKTLTDDEIDEIVNGKRPVINQFNLSFDKQNPSDLQFDFDLGSGQLGAKSIKNIIINGKKLIKDTDFIISNSTVTLNKSIFETLINDTYQVTVIFDNGYTIEDKIKVIVYGEDVILTPDKTVPEQTLYIDKSNLEDAIFTVYCDSIDKVIINNKQLKTEEWELRKKTQLLRNGSTEKPKELIIKKSVLNELKPNEYNVTIVTEGVTLKNLLFLHITGDNINDEPPIILDTIKYEFYKDYPDFIVIPFSFNRASSITEVKIGSNILDSAHYDIVDSTIIIDKDYLSSLDIGKYVVSVTFDDNTKRSNAQLIIYEKAADRAAPYLLQSHIIFNGSSVSLTFDPGEGDLQTTNVLALVIDDKLILPNGDKVDFSSSNINKLQKAYKDYVNEEEIEKTSPSDVKEKEDEENTNIIESEDTNITEDKNTNISDSKETNTNEDKIINNDSENTNIKEDESINNGNKDNIDNEDTDINEDETNINNKEEDNLIKVEIEQVESNSFNLFATLDDYDTIFVTNGTEITLDGAYIESLNLSEGDHLIGAIFDNTERTIDVKKVILTIPKTDSGDKPTPPDDGDKEKPVKPPKPDEGNKPTPPDNNNNNNNGGGSSGGGSSSGGSSGSNSKPDNSKPSPINPDSSLNPDYKPIVPDTGGKFEGNGDDWTYIKPDGNQAKNEWVGDGEDWYYIDENSKLKYDWALINNEWYMLNREHDGKFGAAKYGWYKENQDGQWYFMNPKDTKMLTGWQKINHKWYYFNVNQGEPTYYGDNQKGWKYDKTKRIRPHGSMYVNETTPDGYKTNEKGEWIE